MALLAHIRKCIVFIILVLVVGLQCKKAAPSKETNIIKFFRLFIMRMVYGFASYFGIEEPLEEFAGGALVPPGSDEDYGGGGTKDDYDDDGDYDYGFGSY
ncbi:uncharacterized protein LOC103521865 [Diaphorina citri]|uniref:Uncharacterized protein LOC103521865 n=1 Tax=Diaphorina citri TaxID=121845 RepID=A0A1S3DNW6_DIACI|nr:uncharacterized protein LOC103521865 [Diaphorina citri]KAI5704698.1 hypothetical protein M8J75_007972 [Diaphorina citri]KAI5737671.1 hypothetical protein M8J76_015628 [Diaphorina citri]KAI5742643.1 hypothetical protein M8J77_009656 [Diaphorina citri]